MSLLKILIADDHYLIRDSLKRVVERIASDINICEAGNGTEVLQLVSGMPQFDLILLDLYMPETNGFVLLAKLCDEYPDISVIILSASENSEHMRKALDCGAAGFIPKSTPHEIMINAIKLVLSGGVYIPQKILKKKNLLKNTDNTDTPAFGHFIPETEGELTVRQREVLVLLCEGQQNKEIARNLGLSEHTVKVHITAVFRSLGVTNRTQAVLAAKNLLNQHN